MLRGQRERMAGVEPAESAMATQCLTSRRHPRTNRSSTVESNHAPPASQTGMQPLHLCSRDEWSELPGTRTLSAWLRARCSTRRACNPYTRRVVGRARTGFHRGHSAAPRPLRDRPPQMRSTGLEPVLFHLRRVVAYPVGRRARARKNAGCKRTNECTRRESNPWPPGS